MNWIYSHNNIPEKEEANEIFIVSYVERNGNTRSTIAIYNGFARPSTKTSLWTEVYTGIDISNVYAWARLPEPAKIWVGNFHLG